MADLFNTNANLSLDGDDALVLKGSPKNLDRDFFLLGGENLLQMSISDVEETLDAEEATSEIGETSSVMDAKCKTAKNSTNLVARVERLELRVAIFEKKFSEFKDGYVRKKKNKERRADAVRQSDLEKFVIQAVVKGAGEYGVSKAYIRKYMKDKFNIADTRHIRRRLNKILKKKVETEVMQLDDTKTFYTNAI